MNLSNLQKSALLIVLSCTSELSPKLSTEVISKSVEVIEQKTEYEKICYTEEIEVTEYYTPFIRVYGYSKDGYDVEITVDKKKYFVKYSDIKLLNMEGFIHVYTYDISKDGYEVAKDFYLDHHRKKQKCVLDSKNRPLHIGDVASNYYSDSTIFRWSNQEHMKTDRGSAINGKHHIDLYLGEGNKQPLTKTYIVTVYPYIKPKV